MKKILLAIFSLFVMGSTVAIAQDNLFLNVRIIDPTPAGNGHPKAPVSIPSVLQDNHQLLFEPSHPEYTINILQDGSLIYSIVVPTNATFVTLPSWLEGYYEIQIVPNDSNYYFYSLITL